MVVGISSALSVNSVFVDTISPGEEGTIRVEIENDGNRDVESVSFGLDFSDPKIIPLGSSEAFVNEIKEDDDEIFAFRFKVANNLPVGTYSIPYKIKYEENNDEREQEGIIGVIVSAEPEIEIIADTQNAIVGAQGTLNIKIVNKGLADARFVSLFVESEDLILLSENSEYVGTIDSDDFEISSFDVIYSKRFPSISVKVVYKDFSNNENEIIRFISLKAYTPQEAIEKGILKKSNAPVYVGIFLFLLIVWIVYKIILKRRKNKN